MISCNKDILKNRTIIIRALEEVRKDKSKIILTTDKGVSLVVMDKEEYIREAQALLDQPEYKSIPADPTTRYKNKLISILKSIKAEGGINEVTYRRLYPTKASSPKFYGLPKVCKQGMPLRPIVSSTGAVTYQTAKELSKILKPLVGKSPHHVHNNKDFLQHLKGIQLGPDEVIISYDVKALFTSVPIQPAFTIIEKLLEEDPGLQERMSMTVKNIICLLEFCLRSTYFTFQNQYYEQVEGAAMGSPISPIVANLYMESFESRAISTSPHPHLMWKRFVDMANRYFLIEVPGGIADAYIKFKGNDGIHLLRFSAFECAGYQVGWDEADYPIDCEDYLIEREFMKLKRCHPDPVDLPFPHIHGFTDFYNPACLVCLVGGRVPLSYHRLSPSEMRECFPLIGPETGPGVIIYHDYNRPWSPSSSQVHPTAPAAAAD